MANINQFAKVTMAGILFMATVQPALSAIEIKEDEFGPSYDSMMADAIVGKPAQFLAAVVGTATYALSYPFSYYSGNQQQVKKKLVTEPWNAMYRCFGCTVSEDNYYTSHNVNPNAERRIIGGQYELSIETDADLTIEDPSNIMIEKY